MGLAAPGYVGHRFSMYLSCASTPAMPHVLTSVFTHSDHVFRGLPFFLVPGIWKFVINLRQDVARCTGPCHLSRRQRRTDVMFSTSSFCSSEADGVSSTADSTGVFGRFLEDILVITRDQELGLLHVESEPFTFHASLPCLELGDTTLLGVRDEHQVISVEELPCYASLKLMRQNIHHQNEEQWVKGRTLMHTNTHTKLLTVLTDARWTSRLAAFHFAECFANLGRGKLGRGPADGGIITMTSEWAR